MDKLEEILNTIKKFNKDRNWEQFHTPSNLSKSISIEAAELLECFQWSDEGNIENIKEELADVLIYCLQLSNVLDLNVYDIIENKIKRNAEKYPIDKSYNSSKKYNEFDGETND